MTSKPSLTCETLLKQAAGRIDSDSPRLDAELLLSHVTGLGRTSFRAWPEREVTESQVGRSRRWWLSALPASRWLTCSGIRSSGRCRCKVSASTLIPRPDTECLVEAALGLPLPEQARVLDLGTGTGAIALALASEHSGWRVTACDDVEEAVELARENARVLGLPVSVVKSSWFSRLEPARFDLIVSNPPYIPDKDRHLGEGDVRFEPASALVSGSDGLEDLRLIVTQSPDWLIEGGWLLVEHGFDQAEAVAGLFRERGFAKVQNLQDYGRRDRMTLGQWCRSTAVNGRDFNRGDADAQ